MPDALLYCEEDAAVHKGEGPPSDWSAGLDAASTTPPAAGRQLHSRQEPGRHWRRKLRSSADVEQLSGSRRRVHSAADGREPLFQVADAAGPSGASP